MVGEIDRRSQFRHRTAGLVFGHVRQRLLCDIS